jgi:hypothetical protein
LKFTTIDEATYPQPKRFRNRERQAVNLTRVNKIQKATPDEVRFQLIFYFANNRYTETWHFENEQDLDTVYGLMTEELAAQ